MKKLLTICLLAGLVLAVAPAAWGDPFVNPPESNPNITWVTPEGTGGPNYPNM